MLRVIAIIGTYCIKGLPFMLTNCFVRNNGDDMKYVYEYVLNDHSASTLGSYILTSDSWIYVSFGILKIRLMSWLALLIWRTCYKSLWTCEMYLVWNKQIKRLQIYNTYKSYFSNLGALLYVAVCFLFRHLDLDPIFEMSN